MLFLISYRLHTQKTVIDFSRL